MTLGEAAKELGVSKSTVSRTLSGKGRIGAATRQRILAFAEEHDMLRKPEENTETCNLGVVFPTDIYINGNSYFQECLLGICEAASVMGYHVLVITGTAVDISGIRKLVENRKVDGIILTRSLIEDKAIEYLVGADFPVAVTGLCDYREVIQVDTDNELASEDLTSALIGKGFRKFALILEDFSYRVNRKRYEGFRNALLKNGISQEKQIVHTGNLNVERMDALINDIVARKVECIICGDDVICTRVMSRLQAMGYWIPRDIAIASLYDSQNLQCFTPAVTAVNIMGRQVGSMAARQMIGCLQKKTYESRVMVDYEIMLRKSTK
ncbi:MAG: LacI family DNA-binding transcriptional regulator [Bacteroidales bacterium]|nr:LacI family DNA-binding transcriptional regulator [Bacteroidales bacterium]MCM1416199.1 LacI family DNA-binding transcriptional regulator [bacterium]MCM1424645.1 LacI family DNA-binding transcriptional regulator [bacterium]